MEILQLSIEQRWTACLRLLRNNIPSQQQFDTWFGRISFVSFDPSTSELVLAVPSPFIIEFVESHYLELLRAVLRNIYGERVCLRWMVTVDATNHITETEDAAPHPPANPPVHTDEVNKAPKAEQTLDSHLMADYTFENFVKGDPNKLPLTVGLTVAQNPDQCTFNPLFIYGPSGVGKTHLVNAIGNRVKELHPKKRVLYVSAHLFHVQYVDAVRQNKTNDFIAFYQSIDVLIIDDIQEFAAQEKTLLTFFHIFNHLHQNKRQLILTSDRPPMSLLGMEERFLTRFKWGLLAELERPDEKLRRDILMHKIKRDGIRIDTAVVNYIAHVVDKSIRDLEGVLNSLMAYSVVWSMEIDIPMAERVIARTVGLSKPERPQLTVEDILQQTCQFFCINKEDVLSKSRKATVVQARQVAMYLTQKLTTLSTSRIGMAIGRRNHATVIHSCQSVETRLQSDAQFAEQVGELEQLLN